MSFNEFREFEEKAKKISPDPDDVLYFALALRLRCAVWSNDKKLKEQKIVNILTSEEIFKQK